MTASALLDGRIDWSGTLAQLIAANPARAIPKGILAITSDNGLCISNGTTWVAVAPPTVSLTSVGLTSPDLTITGSPLTANGTITTAFPNGTGNGKRLTLTPQVSTGVYAQSANGILDFGMMPFPGNVYNDAVVAIGYNVSASGMASTASDTFSAGSWFETNYEWTTLSGTATAATTTTLTDSGQTWAVNQYASYTIYITSGAASGLSAKITSNTATALTFPAIAGLTATPTYQILQDDMETYFQWGQNAGTYRNLRPLFFSFTRSHATAQAALGVNGAVTVSAATAANPIVITTSVSHGLKNGNYVKFAAIAGTGWTALNGQQFKVTVLSATTFSIAVNGTGFGTYTVSSGTETAEPILPLSAIMGDSVAGLQIRMPSWSPTGTDNMMTVQPGVVNVFPATPYGTSTLNLMSGVASGGQLIQGYGGFTSAALYPTTVGTYSLTLYDSVGANGVTAATFFRTPIGGGAGGSLYVGGGSGDNSAVIVADNTVNSRGTKGIVIRANANSAAGTGNLLEIQSSASAVKLSVDPSYNMTLTGALADKSYSLQVPVSGFAIACPNNISTLILNPAGTLASGTITLPTTPIDGQLFRVTSSQTVTALTVTATGQTVLGAPTTITATTPFSFIYNLSGTTWYRLS